MKILVEIGHPGHVHHFKNMIWKLEEDGHKIKIVAADKEVALNLLDAYGFCYEKLGKNYKSLTGKLYGLIIKDIRLLKIAREYRPDMFISRCSPHSAQVSSLIHKPHISFNDTEHARVSDMLAIPFTDVICTSTSFKRDFGTKQVRFNGYTELAYLHPNYFKPDPSVLNELGLSKNDRFIILRFVSWSASHDIGQHGFTNAKELITKLEDYGRIFITSEWQLEKEFEKYRIALPPERMHDLLYYATMYIGEGATMASECAVLGTPAIYVNTLRLGYTDEEEEKYGLVYTFSDPETLQEKAFRKVVELLEDENIKKRWQKKRAKLLSDKIDVTKFMTDFIENYPESFTKWETNNQRQDEYERIGR